MEMPGMPLPTMLDAQQPTNKDSIGSLPFALPELELGNISKRMGKRKAMVAEDDDDDPREEAQMLQLLQQMQRVKQSKENKRKRGEIAAKANRLTAGVRKNATKRLEETKSMRAKIAADLRSTMDSLRSALEHETRLAITLLAEQKAAITTAVDILNERYHQAAEVQTKAKLLENYMRQHFHVVQDHVSSQVDIKSSETEEVVRQIHNQPDNMLSILAGAGSS